MSRLLHHSSLKGRVPRGPIIFEKKVADRLASREVHVKIICQKVEYKKTCTI